MKKAILLAIAVIVSFADHAIASPVCDFLAHNPIVQGPHGFIFPKGYVLIGFTPVHLDIDGDGKPDKVVKGPGGTAMEDDFMLELSSDPSGKFTDEPDESQPQAAATAVRNDALGTLWFRWNGRMYSVEFVDNRDYAQPIRALYYIPGGKYRVACIFSNDMRRLSWRIADGVPSKLKARAEEICRETGTLPPRKFGAVAMLSEQGRKYIRRYPFRETTFDPACELSSDRNCRDIWEVDYDNSGTRHRLLKLYGASGAGRGCDAQRFIVLGVHDRPVAGDKEILPETMTGDCASELTWAQVGQTVVLYGQTEGYAPDTMYLQRGTDASPICIAPFHIQTSITFSEE